MSCSEEGQNCFGTSYGDIGRSILDGDRKYFVAFSDDRKTIAITALSSSKQIGSGVEYGSPCEMMSTTGGETLVPQSYEVEGCVSKA